LSVDSTDPQCSADSARC